MPACGNGTKSLLRYDAACIALAAAKSVDEVLEISAQADAVRAYAKQAKNRQLEIDAAEICIRAERRLGELMAAHKAMVGVNSGTAGQGRPKIGGVPNTPPNHDAPPTLAEAGIDKNPAKRARTYAAVPTEQFEQLLTDKRQSENRRVVLDPAFQAEAEAAARDIEIERDERIALAGAEDLVGENEKLARQVAGLTRRIAALIDENGALKYREKLWKERALAAGWKGGPIDSLFSAPARPENNRRSRMRDGMSSPEGHLAPKTTPDGACSGHTAKLPVGLGN